ncbi:hypothetical protein [Nocardioides sp. W7]|uniref:hypothetical protein n=1 Tax=Nocardioides sp. W7 TaxID=2931390 RepID=UPI001FD32DCB|nr:hypothetical protein [Nocardioides sp. W7]
MPEPILMPVMAPDQELTWHALMDLYERVPADWALIGGQLVHLHCAERGASPHRPTLDIDTVVDIRASQTILQSFTGALAHLGFTPDTSGDGVQHRWRRHHSQIDVLIPEGVGERAAARPGAGGAPTISAPGTTQALARSEPVRVQVGDRVGTLLRPNLVGALVAKAAARTEVISDSARARHCSDFVVLAGLISARDFRDTEPTRKDKQRLSKMLAHCRDDPAAMAVDESGSALDRLERAAKLSR